MRLSEQKVQVVTLPCLRIRTLRKISPTQFQQRHSSLPDDVGFGIQHDFIQVRHRRIATRQVGECPAIRTVRLPTGDSSDSLIEHAASLVEPKSEETHIAVLWTTSSGPAWPVTPTIQTSLSLFLKPAFVRTSARTAKLAFSLAKQVFYVTIAYTPTCYERLHLICHPKRSKEPCVCLCTAIDLAERCV